jgi:hypothetical protein
MQGNVLRKHTGPAEAGGIEEFLHRVATAIGVQRQTAEWDACAVLSTVAQAFPAENSTTSSPNCPPASRHRSANAPSPTDTSQLGSLPCDRILEIELGPAGQCNASPPPGRTSTPSRSATGLNEPVPVRRSASVPARPAFDWSRLAG